VDEQDELAVLGREEQPLGPPLGARQRPPVERGKRRVECLQRRHVRRARVLDGKRAHRVVEGAPKRFYLG